MATVYTWSTCIYMQAKTPIHRERKQMFKWNENFLYLKVNVLLQWDACVFLIVWPSQGLSFYMEFFLSKDTWFSSSKTHADYSQTCENTSCLTWTLEFLLRSGKVQESALYRVPRCWCGSPGDTLQVTVRLHNSYPTGDSEIIPQAYTQCCRWIFNTGGPIRMQEMEGERACRNPDSCQEPCLADWKY